MEDEIAERRANTRELRWLLRTISLPSVSTNQMSTCLPRLRKLLKHPLWSNTDKAEFGVGETLVVLLPTFIPRSPVDSDELEEMREEVVRILNMVPMDRISRMKLCDIRRLSSIVRVLDRGSFKGRKDAMQLMSKVAAEESMKEKLGGAPGVLEGLLDLLSICNTDQRAEVASQTIMTLQSICSKPRNRLRALHAGAIRVLQRFAGLPSSAQLIYDIQNWQDPDTPFPRCP